METLTQSANLEEFFIARIREALATQKTSVSLEVEYYLVHLLTHFARSTHFFHTTPDGRVEDRPLALRLYDATFDAGRRFLHLKSLGDTALYSAGVFFDGLGDRRGSIEYYISMGAGAYGSLANLSTHGERHMADTFDELSKRFPELVEILNLSCERGGDHDVFRLLERWRHTRSLRAREKLAAQGIHPDLLPHATKAVQ